MTMDSIQKMLSLGEGQRTEFKPNTKSVDALGRVICGFLNTSGGYLICGMDDRGKTKLSMKVVDQTTGEDITDKINAERAERGEPPLSDDTGGRPKREGGGDRDRGRSRR